MGGVGWSGVGVGEIMGVMTNRLLSGKCKNKLMHDPSSSNNHNLSCPCFSSLVFLLHR